MFAVAEKHIPAASSSQHDTTEVEGVVESKKGFKPSLAERNRERQQRFRQRQKSRIEELEARCQKLTSNARNLSAEKDDLVKSVSLLKELVQVRDLQLVAVTSQLAQHLPSGGEVKLEAPALAGLEAVLHQQEQEPALTLEAVQSAQQEAQVEIAELQARMFTATPSERPSSTDTQAHEMLSGLQPASSPGPLTTTPAQPHSPQLALDQLCRVAEMAEMQRTESSSPATTCLPETCIDASSTAASQPDLYPHLTAGFERLADVRLIVDGQPLLVHSAVLAAHSEHFAQVFRELRLSQPLFASAREPLDLPLAGLGKHMQDMLLFLSHCYGSLDLEPIPDCDLMRLVMLADELGARALLHVCDATIVGRAESQGFSYFVGLSQGGDLVDWLRLADRLGLERVGGLCETHLARHLKENRTWRENTRLNELGQDCLLRVINKLAEL